VVNAPDDIFTPLFRNGSSRRSDGNGAFRLPDLAISLNKVGIRLGELGRRADALAGFCECGALLIQIRSSDPHMWIWLAGGHQGSSQKTEFKAR
jgi:hypothetical protein